MLVLKIWVFDRSREMRRLGHRVPQAELKDVSPC